ncbi:MAG: hypothetical protein WBG50_17625 [Desulfomonilaceae bacterium]
MEYLNDLIRAAQAILDSGFDVQSFLGWKEVALLTLLGLLGPLHYYTRTFKQNTSAQNPLSLLAGEGILMAAKEEMLKSINEQSGQQSQPGQY